MAYNKTVWKLREVEKPRRYNVQVNSDGSRTFNPAPGVIIEPGTPLNAANMNKIEQGILNVDAGITTHAANTSSHTFFCTTTNPLVDTETVYTGTIPGVTSYVDGLQISFLIIGNNVGNPKLKINSLAAIPIYNQTGNLIKNAEMRATTIVTARYRSGAFILQDAIPYPIVDWVSLAVNSPMASYTTGALQAKKVYEMVYLRFNFTNTATLNAAQLYNMGTMPTDMSVTFAVAQVLIITATSQYLYGQLIILNTSVFFVCNTAVIATGAVFAGTTQFYAV